MDVASLKFAVFCLFGSAIFWMLPRKLRLCAWFPLLNLMMLYGFSPSVEQFAPFVFYILLGYLCVIAAAAKRRKTWLSILIPCFVIVFAVLRKYSILRFSTAVDGWFAVGVSYILFRVIHVVVDAYQGTITRRVGLLEYFAYTCNFLTLISGPIQRFEDFSDQMENPQKVDQTTISNASTRVIVGLFKCLVFGEIVRITQAIYVSPPYSLLQLLLATHLYTLYLYLNFSGYTDIVIGYGKLFGLKITENFNEPFRSKNFLDLWSRWHITLSDWFKIYLFNPLVSALSRRWPSRSLTFYFGLIGFFVTFFVMGLWHGSTAIFIIYGLFLGLGVMLNKFYQIKIKTLLPKRTREILNRNEFYVRFCMGLTYSYFSFGLMCFWSTINELIALSQSPGLVFATFISGAVLVALIGWIVDNALKFFALLTLRPSFIQH